MPDDPTVPSAPDERADDRTACFSGLVRTGPDADPSRTRAEPGLVPPAGPLAAGEGTEQLTRITGSPPARPGEPGPVENGPQVRDTQPAAAPWESATLTPTAPPPVRTGIPRFSSIT